MQTLFHSKLYVVTMGNIKRILGDNIRGGRITKGWTQVYVADRLQITAPFLAQIESGKKGTSLELVESIAELFDIPIASLFLEKTYTATETRETMQVIQLRIIEKQLQETVSENIKRAFEKLYHP